MDRTKFEVPPIFGGEHTLAVTGRTIDVYYDYLDDESIVVNAKVGKIETSSAIDEHLSNLASLIASILNSADPDYEWVVHSEPNYWSRDGQELEVDDTADLEEGETVQWCIYRYEKKKED